MAVVVFDPATFKLRYPEFSGVVDARLSLFFDEATLYLNNTSTSIVQDIPRRTVLLNMLTAHVGFLGGALATDGQARPVGRVSSAGEGSVNASFEFTQPTPGSGAWFAQSQYGVAFWQATSSLRSATYRPRRTCY